MTSSPTDMPGLWVDDAQTDSSPGLFAAALVLAGIFHLLLVLGVSFELPAGTHDKRTMRALEIVVLRQAAPTQEAPELADAFAQVNRVGGGIEEMEQPDVTPTIEPTIDQVPEISDAEFVQAESLPPPLPLPAQALEPQAPALVLDETLTAPIEPGPASSEPLASLQSRAQPEPEPAPLPEPPPEPEPDAEIPPPPVAPAVTTAQILASRTLEIAELSSRIQNSSATYAHRPRRRAINASTREYKYASYLEAWRRKVERVGNLNYPEEAKRHKMYGNLILHVAVHADGSIDRVHVLRSSGFDVLDQAAVKIVELAAPFAPFPPEIRKETDILDITRTWQFLSSNRLGWKN